VNQESSTSSACAVASKIATWALVDEAGIDIDFVQRLHRRRLSLTTRLALTAYHRCNPELAALRTVFSSRYGEYARTFGIIENLAAGEPASPAAFSLSVHNTPAAIMGIATGNTAATSTLAAGSSTLEAGFLEAAMQRAELNFDEDIVLVFVDEPLPEIYEAFKAHDDRTHAIALRLSTHGQRTLRLSWAQAPTMELSSAGVPGIGVDITAMLAGGQGRAETGDGRTLWTWRVNDS